MSNVTESPFHDLPRPLTSLVEREHEIALVCALLRRADVRLVTLVGPGGVGKTRVAIATAEALRASFPDGIAFVSLQDISDPDLVETALAASLGVPDTGDRSLRDGMIAKIGAGSVLLVIDNFEHVLASAGQVGELLRACAELRVLVTSRVLLNVYGEHEHVVPPLAVPSSIRKTTLADPRSVASVQLFVTRARMANEKFALTDANDAAIADICERLEGIPLAIELAAARSRLLPPDALLARLEQRLPLLAGGPRDVPERQRTLQDTIDWSYDLLTGNQQRLLGQLSVFAGGWTTEAAQAVCDSNLDVLGGLGALIDHSIIHQTARDDEPMRFRMLETIREYAANKLETIPAEAEMFRRRHAEFFARSVDPFGYLLGNFPDADELTHWVAFVRRELANYRAALAWARSRDSRGMLRLAACLGYFWAACDHWSEGRRWLELALATATEPTLERLIALYHLSWIMAFQGDTDAALPIAEECLSIARELEHPHWIVYGMTAVARARDFAGEYDIAISLYEEAASLASQHEVVAALPVIHGNLAGILVDRGDVDRAEALLREAYDLGQSLGWTEASTIWLNSLGRIAVQREDTGEARTMLTESLTASVKVDARMRVVDNLEGFAGVTVLERRPDIAARLIGFCDAERERLGYPINVAEQAFRNQIATSSRELLGDVDYAAGYANGRLLASDDAVALALASDQPVVATVDQRSILSPRELEVVRLLADGRTDREIGQSLSISHRTVTTHVANILNKLGLESRTAAATWAVRQGLV